MDNCVHIRNVVSFADRVVSPDGDMVYPFMLINLKTPPGVHHNHKYWEMEMVLDSDWLKDHTGWDYWQNNQDVQSTAGNQYAIRCDADNDWIEWFKVYIRESNGTQTCLTFADEDENVVWCIGRTAEFDNETGERHQTVTFRFICLQERGKTYTDIDWEDVVGVNELAVKFMRIDSVNLAGNICTNILRFKDDFLMLMTPQFRPNTFQGLDLKQDQEWRLLTFIVDSETDIFDTYIDITTANTVLALPFVVSLTLADGAGTVEQWQYSALESYIINRREGRISSDVPRDTIEYQVFTVCTRGVAHP